MSDPERATLAAVADQHLPPALARRWTAMLRPAVRLRHAAAHGPSAGRLGGLPALPDGVDWPVCGGHGPLTFIAAVDCAALPPDRLDIALPADGTLLFFYFGDVDDLGRIGDRPADTEQNRAILAWAEAKGLPLVMPDYWPEHDHVTTRVIHVPAGTPVAERDAPAGATVYERVPLAAEPIVTGPDLSHPALRGSLADPAAGDPLRGALWKHAAFPRHRVGGYALPIQDAPERPPLTLLLQVDSDRAAGMMWGDCGTLYWLIRPDDLAAGRFDRVAFTWDCS